MFITTFGIVLLVVIATLSAVEGGNPTASPSASPSAVPTASPSALPTFAPTASPSALPTLEPTASPSAHPSASPSAEPTVTPTAHPTASPSGKPSPAPSPEPTAKPTTYSPTPKPTVYPTSSPTITAEGYETVFDYRKRHRKGGYCENHCGGHGECKKNKNCECHKNLDGEPAWTGPDCSLRTCPKDFSWVGSVVNANDLHPWQECSNRGLCDRKTGSCQCFAGYDGVACQRTLCPNDCSGRGICWPESHLATFAGRTYSLPWDAMKEVGCVCDAGYRGPGCELQECPSGADPLDGYGNEAGRECSGRGLCDYTAGICGCFSGFYGTHCQYQTTLF